MTDYFPRDILGEINKTLKEMPVVVLTGMRQTGKTTFLTKEKELSKRNYFTLDDWNTVEIAKSNPEVFLNTKSPITIDEIQKLPELIPFIKKVIDTNRKKGQFLLSGSANLSLLQQVTESLAGRAIYLTMTPLTNREIQKNHKSPFLLEIFDKKEIKGNSTPISDSELIMGGMPSIVLEKTNREIWWKGYIQTYLERDLRDFGRIHDLIPFRNLIYILALRNGGIVSISDLARDCKLNTATIAKYLHILESSFILTKVPPYLKNPASRIIKSPKIYFSDSGMVTYLCGIKNSKSPLYIQKKGNTLETYVLQNLTGILSSIGNGSIYYWGIQGRQEVDFIIELDGQCIAIEIKSSSKFVKDDIHSIKSFMEITPSCTTGILAYNGTKVMNLDKNIYAVPIRLLLS